LTVELLPITSAVGVTETLSLVAKASNLSNVGTNTKFQYEITTPSGEVIKSSGISQVTVFLQPQSTAVQKLLVSFPHTFMVSGQYTVDIFHCGGTAPDLMNTIGMQVFPGLRIDAEKEASPDLVRPSPDQRIRINVRLNGKEVQ